MSLAASRESKSSRRHCRGCGSRRARFQFRGHVRADRDHTLCFECFRSETDRRRAMVMRASGTTNGLPADRSLRPPRQPFVDRAVAL